MMLHNIDELAFVIGVTAENLPTYLFRNTKSQAEIDYEADSFSIGACEPLSGMEFCKDFQFPVEAQEVIDWLEELDRLYEEAQGEVNDQIGL